MERERLLALAVKCPTCGRRPKLRVPAADVIRWQHEDPVRVIQTYECHRCGTRYQILAAAFQEAA